MPAASSHAANALSSAFHSNRDRGNTGITRYMQMCMADEPSDSVLQTTRRYQLHSSGGNPSSSHNHPQNKEPKCKLLSHAE